MTTPPTPDAVSSYEDLAEQFYDATHVMAPGKDVSAAMGEYDAELLRHKLWRVWLEKRTLTAQLAAAKPLSEWRILNARGEAVADATHPDEHTLPWWDRSRPKDAPHRLVQLAVIDAARTAAVKP